MPLHRFPIVETRNIEEMRSALISAYGAVAFDCRTAPDAFRGIGRSWSHGGVSLAYCDYRDHVEIQFPDQDIVRQFHCLEGRARIAANGVEMAFASGGSCTIAAEQAFKAQFEGHYRQLVLRLDIDAVRRRLSHLTGAPVGGDLEFSTQVDGAGAPQNLTRQLLLLLVEQLGADVGTVPDLVLTEICDTLTTAFLHATDHTYRKLLDSEPRSAAPWQLRRAVQYIEAHWNDPLSIETLAAAASCSGRSLFKTFRDTLGCTPMAFVKRKRLEEAHRRLKGGDRSSTVASVAFACGFSNAGHFARDYQKVFGEKPSETLRRSLGNRAP